MCSMLMTIIAELWYDSVVHTQIIFLVMRHNSNPLFLQLTTASHHYKT